MMRDVIVYDNTIYDIIIYDNKGSSFVCIINIFIVAKNQQRRNVNFAIFHTAEEIFGYFRIMLLFCG
jgi:hypothetical protein